MCLLESDCCRIVRNRHFHSCNVCMYGHVINFYSRIRRHLENVWRLIWCPKNAKCCATHFLNVKDLLDIFEKKTEAPFLPQTLLCHKLKFLQRRQGKSYFICVEFSIQTEMDNHQSFYNDQHTYNPRQNIRINRELLKANRCSQRRERFQGARNLSPSPIRNKKGVVIPLCQADEGNVDDCISQQQNPNTTRLAKIVCNGINTEKLTKKAAFIKRFVEWKENKKNMKKQDLNKKKPFVAAVNSNNIICSNIRQTTTSSSLVPRGHHKNFRPPAGLKNPTDNEEVEQNQSPDVKGRQPVYTVVPTPPRKHPHEKNAYKFPTNRKVLPTNLPPKILSSKKTPISATNSARTTKEPIMLTEKLNDRTLQKAKKSTVRKSPATKSIAKKIVGNLPKSLEKVKRTTTTANSAKPLLRKNITPQNLKMPIAPTSTRAGTDTNVQTGGIGKVRTVTQKRTELAKQTKNSPLKRGARLAQNLKAKKTLNISKKVNVPALQINGKMLLNLLKKDVPVDNMIVQTPRDFATTIPFDEFVTSTRIKNTSKTIKNVEKISRIETLHKKSHSTSAKRNIMQDATNTTLVKESTENKKNTFKDGLQNEFKKYNFIRYSEPADATAIDRSNDEIKVGEDLRFNALDEKENEQKQTPGMEETTPTKFGPEERPINYLSPFVSVARGKVSLKKEKEKRNSVYLPNAAESYDLLEQSTSQSTQPKYSTETRRTLETVRYFRKQLQDEIERLHKMCDIWEVYKKENLEKVQNANGEDMINVTVGQTRLLTNKKFMQFKGLIDRCEAGATGIGLVEYDGSEATKPITSVDLEGFWSMLGLQVDNLEKRFDNLNRWKLNDWNDPDDVKPKIKKNLTKIKKSKAAPVTKAKPNLALQQMLRKMQAEMRKNKNKSDNINEDVVLLPTKLKNCFSENSKSVNTSTSRRLSITVKDRKYFSPAATVISVLSPIRRTNKPRSPQILTPHIQNFNQALDSMQSSSDLRKSVLLNEYTRRISLNQQSPTIGIKSNDHKTSLVSANLYNKGNAIFTEETACNSPVPTVRKSILKTPGTSKSRLRNVIFNEKLRVKKFNFFVNEDGDPFEPENTNNTHEENLAKNFEEEAQGKHTTTYINYPKP